MVNKASKSRVKPKVIVSRRLWSNAENGAVLRHLISLVKQGKLLEKPNATAFYDKVAETLKLENCTGSQIKNQVRNLKTKYGNALKWRNQTGQGVLEEEGEESVKKALLKLCPWFDELDEIYGDKANFDPPHLHESSMAKNSEDGEELLDPTEREQFENKVTPEDVLSEASKQITSSKSSSLNEISLNSKVGKVVLGKRKQPDSGISALAETAKMRIEVQKDEIVLAREKWAHEKLRQELVDQFEAKKYEDKKNLEMQKLKLEEDKLKTTLELERYRIEQECKMKIEIARIQFQSNM